MRNQFQRNIPAIVYKAALFQNPIPVYNGSFAKVVVPELAKQFVALVQRSSAMLISSPAILEADTSLATQLKKRNQQAFAQLYDLYAGPLFGFICRATSDTIKAEALLQEVFVRAWNEIDSYDPEHERLFTWMFLITRAACDPKNESLKSINL